MGRFGPLDASTDLFDKDETIRTVAAHCSAEVDTSDFMSSDSVASLAIAIDFQGLDSGGAATVVLTVLSSTTATATDVIYTSKTYTLAQAKATFAGTDGYILPLSNAEISNFTRINLAVGVAVLTAGVCNAGIIPIPI